MAPAVRLTEVGATVATRGRWRRGVDPFLRLLSHPGNWGRVLLRTSNWAWEVGSATLLDPLDARRSPIDPILRRAPGENPMPEATGVAVMIQFSPDGRLSAMVRRQIETWRALGFAVVLVSNSPTFPEAEWEAARRLAALVIHRRNGGLDFGAWKDVVPLARSAWPAAEELLIVNDSVLGPIRSLDPVIETMRSAGPGVFGLLESIQGGPHLQSWFVLARGQAAVDGLAGFLAGVRLSRSKWTIIQRGELMLARTLRAQGHRVAAVYGYSDLVDLALGDAKERAYLLRALPAWFVRADRNEMRRRLLERPVNPAHHLWRVLTGLAGCPFVKTELVRRNPGRLPGIDAWQELVPDDAPCTVAILRDHLDLLGP